MGKKFKIVDLSRNTNFGGVRRDMIEVTFRFEGNPNLGRCVIETRSPSRPGKKAWRQAQLDAACRSIEYMMQR